MRLADDPCVRQVVVLGHAEDDRAGGRCPQRSHGPTHDQYGGHQNREFPDPNDVAQASTSRQRAPPGQIHIEDPAPHEGAYFPVLLAGRVPESDGTVTGFPTAWM